MEKNKIDTKYKINYYKYFKQNGSKKYLALPPHCITIKVLKII